MRIALALPAFLPSAFFQYFIYFFAKLKEGAGSPGPSPRSATGSAWEIVEFEGALPFVSTGPLDQPVP